MLSSAAGVGKTCSERKPFHILTTKFLAGNEVLVHFSDGSAAIFEAEELEKLRPTPKQILATAPSEPARIAATETVFIVTPAAEPERPLVLDRAIA